MGCIRWAIDQRSGEARIDLVKSELGIGVKSQLFFKVRICQNINDGIHISSQKRNHRRRKPTRVVAFCLWVRIGIIVVH